MKHCGFPNKVKVPCRKCSYCRGELAHTNELLEQLKQEKLLLKKGITKESEGLKPRKPLLI
jgi:hypothetical protein